MSRRALVPMYVQEKIDGMKSERERRGLTRKEVSEGTGIECDTLRSYENNVMPVGRPSYNKLAYFFGWEEWK